MLTPIVLGTLLGLNILILVLNIHLVCQKRTKVTTNHLLITVDKLEANLILIISMLH